MGLLIPGTANAINAAFDQALQDSGRIGIGLGGASDIAAILDAGPATSINVLPSQMGEGGNFLMTDGSGNVSWAPAGGGLPPQTGQSGKFLTTNGTLAAWANVSGSLPGGGLSGQLLVSLGGSDGAWATTSNLLYSFSAGASVRVFDIRNPLFAGGAKPWDGLTYGWPGPSQDSWPAFESAFEAMIANSNNLGGSRTAALYVPGDQGIFYISRPLCFPAYCTMFGDSDLTSQIYASIGSPQYPQYLQNFAGPMINLGRQVGPLNIQYTTDPFGNANLALVLDASGITSTNYLPLHDAYAWSSFVDSYTWTGFSLQCWVKIDGGTLPGGDGDNCSVIGSRGIQLGNLTNLGAGASVAFGIYFIQAGSTVNCLMAFQNNAAEFVMPDGNWHNYEMSWNGSRIYFYFDGVLQNAGGTAFAGPMLQYPWEGVSIGRGGLENGASWDTINGGIASIRLSNVARHTSSSFTLPVAPYAWDDPYTYALLNWDQGAVNSYEPFVLGQCRQRAADYAGNYVPHFIRTMSTSSYDVQLRNLFIGCTGNQSGIINLNGAFLDLDHIWVAGATQFGISSYDGGSFYSTAKYLSCYAQNIPVLLALEEGGKNFVLSGQVGGWLTDGKFDQAEIQPGSGLFFKTGAGNGACYTGFILGGSGYGEFSSLEVSGLGLDTEGTFPRLQAGAVLLSVQSFYSHSNGWASFGGAGTPNNPPFLIQYMPSGPTMVMEADQFYSNTGTPSAIGFVSGYAVNTYSTVEVRNCFNNQAVNNQPWAQSGYESFVTVRYPQSVTNQLTIDSQLASGLTVTSHVTDGANAVGIAFNQTGALSTIGSKLFTVANNNIVKWWIDNSGSTPDTFYQFNVKSYGATGDGTTDDVLAIQACFDAAVAYSLANGNIGVTVFFPVGTYACSTPLYIGYGGVRILGAGYSTTVITKKGFWFGSTIVWSPKLTFDLDPIPFTTSLLTGPGNAYSLQPFSYPTNANDYQLDLVSVPGNSWLNGNAGGNLTNNTFGQFCAELTMKTAAAFIPATITTMWASYGKLYNEDAQNGAFFLSIFDADAGNPVLYAWLTTVDSGQVVLEGVTKLLANTQYHVALSYDGTTIRLWLNGALEASAPATGNVVQQWWEDLILGPAYQIWPEQNMLFAASNVIVDSPRLSSIARYTAPFTPPTAKFTDDANTIFLTNFEIENFGSYTTNAFVKCYMATYGLGSSPAHIFMRRNIQGPGMSEMSLEQITMNAGGLEMCCINNWNIDGYYANAGAFAIYAVNNCFTGQARNMYFTNQLYASVVNTFAGGITKYSDWQVTGGVPITGTGFTAEHAYFQYTRGCIIGDGAGGGDGEDATFKEVIMADEGHSGSYSPIQARNVGVGGNGGLVFENCTIEKTFDATYPLIQVGGTASMLYFKNCELNAGVGTPSVFFLKSQQTKFTQWIIEGTNRWAEGSGDPKVPLLTDAQKGWVGLIDLYKNAQLQVNVLDYGADPTGLVNSTVAFQAAINSTIQPNLTYSGGCIVEVPPGVYQIEKPLKLRNTTKIKGAGSDNTVLANQNVPGAAFFSGPMLMVTTDDADQGIHIGTNLLTGGTKSMQVYPGASGPYSVYLNLSEYACGDFNLTPLPGFGGGGDGSFSAEYTFNIDSDDPTGIGNYEWLVGSAGQGPNNPSCSVWNITLFRTGANTWTLLYTVTLGGIKYTYNSFPAIGSGSNHHVAISFQHTNGTAYACLDGQVALITTQPGAQPNMQPYEAVYVGDQIPGIGPPDSGGPINNGFKGRIDNIRFSNIQRYNTAYSSPTAKFTIDSNTLLLLDFNTFYGCNPVGQGWTVGIGIPYNYYFVPRAVVNGYVGINIEGMTLANPGYGVWYQGEQGAIIDVKSFSSNIGFFFYGNAFLNHGERLYWEAGAPITNPVNGISSRAGIYSTAAAGFWDIENLFTDGGNMCGVFMTRPSLMITNWDMQPEVGTRWGLMAYHADDFDGVVISGLGVDIEQTTTQFEGAVYLSGVRNASFYDCEFGSNRSDGVVVPCIQLDSTNNTTSPDLLTIVTGGFLPNATATLIQQNGAGRASIILENCRTINAVSNTLSNDLTNITAIGGEYGGGAGKILLGGNVEVSTTGSSFILKSPNNTRYRITVDNSGNLSTTLA